jgi:hypothetical protein
VILGVRQSGTVLPRVRGDVHMESLSRFLRPMVIAFFVLAAAVAGAQQQFIEGELHCAQTDSMTILLEWTVENLEGVEAFMFMRGVDPEFNPVVLMDVVLPPESPGQFEDTDVWPGSTFLYILRPLMSNGGLWGVTEGSCSVTIEETPVQAGTWALIKSLYR